MIIFPPMATPDTTHDFSLTLTDPAIARVKELLSDNDLPSASAGLRLAVLKGGCSGLNYEVDLAAGPTAEDYVIERDGARVFVDRESALHLNGLTVNYVSTMQSKKFVFENPNATGECGCGISFTTT